jgi:putative transposase
VTSLRYRPETSRSITRQHRISAKVFKFTVNLISEHLKFPAAKNSLYNSKDINHCLIQLSLSEGYAESGLANLSEKCNIKNSVPTGRTFRGKIEHLEERQIREALTKSNNQVLQVAKSYGIFRRKTVVAIDYTRDLFYGNPNAKNVIGGKHEKGTTWGYSYASIDIVEAGRRLTLYTMTVNQFTEKAQAVEKLINEAKARGVHIGLVLLDRAFFTVDVITTLLRLGVYFIIPAVKNGKVKKAMLNYDKEEPAKRFTLGDQRKSVSFNLVIYPRIEEQLPKKKKLNVDDLYYGFATNFPRSLAVKVPTLIPSEYRCRWGIETGYRVQDNVQAKTTSRKYVVRLLYHLTSVLLYNVWNYANLLLCRAMKRQFEKPLLKLTRLAMHFEGFIIGGLGPPRP